MKIFVTGASGFLGSTICKYLLGDKAQNHQVYAGYNRNKPAFGQAVQVDLTDTVSTEQALAEIGNDCELIIHTAYSHNAELFEPLIVKGTELLARHFADARFIYMSSDFVFDGNGPYSETDKPAPQTLYGRAKLAAEQATQNNCPNYVVVRSSLISGTNPIPPRWATEKQKLLNGQKLTFYANEIRNPIHVDDLARGILEVAFSDFRGVIHIAGPEYVSRFEELQLFVRWQGLSEDLISSNLSDGKNRPLNCSLKIDYFLQHFTTPLRAVREFWQGTEPQ